MSAQYHGYCLLCKIKTGTWDVNTTIDIVCKSLQLMVWQLILGVLKFNCKSLPKGFSSVFEFWLLLTCIDDLILGCNYVLHSTGQLFSHKRKHERRDYETAYKRYKEDSVPTTMVATPSGDSVMSVPVSNSSNQEFVDLEDLSKMDGSNNSSGKNMTQY